MYRKTFVIITLLLLGLGYSCKTKEEKKRLSLHQHIPAGDALVYELSPDGSVKALPVRYYQGLTEASLKAIDKAPRWLRLDLKDALVQIDSLHQEKWARCILDAKDPYVDETAFVISTMGPQWLEHPRAYPELLKLNAEYIYKYDSLLPYVEVADYGSALMGGDYYTSTRYKYRDPESGQIYEEEIPRGIYYWYVVHPEVSEEFPGFFNPDTPITRANKHRTPTSPDSGVFWREYILNHQNPDLPNTDFGDSTHYVMSNAKRTASRYWSKEQYTAMAHHVLDSLQQSAVVWDGVATSTDPGTTDTIPAPGPIEMQFGKQFAIAQINKYVWSMVIFWSVDAYERGHQPVRSLTWGTGRCGEHEDFTTAMGRTALIPTVGVEAISANHVWNAFWHDGDWVIWENQGAGYINTPEARHDGEKNHWGTVFHIRGDCYTMDVTDRYSESGQIRIRLTDRKGRPLDGFMVKQYGTDTLKDFYVGDIIRNTWSDGAARFRPGEGNWYAHSVIADTLTLIRKRLLSPSALTPDTLIERTYQLDTLIPGQQISLIDEKIKTSEKTIKLKLNVIDEILYGHTTYHWLGREGTPWQYRVHVGSTASVDVALVDKENLEKYYAGEDVEAIRAYENVREMDEDIALPAKGKHYLIVRNELLNNFVQIEGKIGQKK
jgi:hypothetical protein